VSEAQCPFWVSKSVTCTCSSLLETNRRPARGSVRAQQRFVLPAQNRVQKSRVQRYRSDVACFSCPRGRGNINARDAVWHISRRPALIVQAGRERHSRKRWRPASLMPGCPARPCRHAMSLQRPGDARHLPLAARNRRTPTARRASHCQERTASAAWQEPAMRGRGSRQRCVVVVVVRCRC